MVNWPRTSTSAILGTVVTGLTIIVLATGYDKNRDFPITRSPKRTEAKQPESSPTHTIEGIVQGESMSHDYGENPQYYFTVRGQPTGSDEQSLYLFHASSSIARELDAHISPNLAVKISYQNPLYPQRNNAIEIKDLKQVGFSYNSNPEGK